MSMRDDEEVEEQLAQRKMEKRMAETANNTIGPGITRPVLVRPGKLMKWAKAGILDPKLLPEKLKETMLRLSTAETLKIIGGDKQSLDDVIFAFEIARVDGARVPVLNRLLQAERNRETPRTKTITDIKAAINKALGMDKDELKAAQDEKVPEEAPLEE